MRPMISATAAAALLVTAANAFPALSENGDLNNDLLRRQQSAGSQPGGPVTCPFNANHVPAQPVTAEFPYNNAVRGAKGNERGGYLVPDPADPFHQYIAPKSTDIRGPCPALNAAANYGFIARDGITTYNELVDACQNVYNVAHDLAVFLATYSLTLADGDVLTQRLSIGCDATTRTSVSPLLTGPQPGLDGHNKFELDTSLTRNDYFLGNGDNFSLNTTLYRMMVESTNGTMDLPGLAKYRYERYWQSRNNNPNFFFGPFGFFTHGAASFVYSLFPSGADSYQPTLPTISTFFGAQVQPDGSYKAVPERIPTNWTNRVDPYSLIDVGVQIALMYGAYPVAFGGNAGTDQFIGTDYRTVIKNGTLHLNLTDTAGLTCLLFQTVTGPLPSALNVVVTPGVKALTFALTKLTGLPIFANLGCPIALT